MESLDYYIPKLDTGTLALSLGPAWAGEWTCATQDGGATGVIEGVLCVCTDYTEFRGARGRIE
jgi:hypothetical protein